MSTATPLRAVPDPPPDAEYVAVSAREAARLYALLAPYAGRSIPVHGTRESVDKILAALRFYTAIWGTPLDAVTPLAADPVDQATLDAFAAVEDRDELEALLATLAPSSGGSWTSGTASPPAPRRPRPRSLKSWACPNSTCPGSRPWPSVSAQRRPDMMVTSEPTNLLGDIDADIAAIARKGGLLDQLRRLIGTSVRNSANEAQTRAGGYQSSAPWDGAHFGVYFTILAEAVEMERDLRYRLRGRCRSTGGGLTSPRSGP